MLLLHYGRKPASGIAQKSHGPCSKTSGTTYSPALDTLFEIFLQGNCNSKTVSKVFYIGIVFILALIWIVGVIVGPVAHDSLLILFGVYAVYKIVEHNSGSSSVHLMVS